MLTKKPVAPKINPPIKNEMPLKAKGLK